jgi:hypothetical protein
VKRQSVRAVENRLSAVSAPIDELRIGGLRETIIVNVIRAKRALITAEARKS